MLPGTKRPTDWYRSAAGGLWNRCSKQHKLIHPAENRLFPGNLFGGRAAVIGPAGLLHLRGGLTMITAASMRSGKLCSFRRTRADRPCQAAATQGRDLNQALPLTFKPGRIVGIVSPRKKSMFSQSHFMKTGVSKCYTACL